MNKRDISIGLLNDFHVGSAFGLWPEKFEGSCGAPKLNVGQGYLLDNWMRIAKEIPDLDILIVNGDAIDGQAPKDEGRYIIEPDPQFQARAAVKLLEPWKKRVKKGGQVYCTEGTRYHEDVGSTWSEYIAKELGSVPVKDNRYSWDWLLLQAGWARVDIAHRQSMTIAYRSTMGERELNYSEMQNSPADLVIRAHSHYYFWLQMARDNRVQYYLSSPSWQLSSNYCRTSISPNRKVDTVLGMVVVVIEKGGNIRHVPYLFDHPPMRVAQYAQYEIEQK